MVPAAGSVWTAAGESAEAANENPEKRERGWAKEAICRRGRVGTVDVLCKVGAGNAHPDKSRPESSSR